jgi:hypothetical protein
MLDFLDADFFKMTFRLWRFRRVLGRKDCKPSGQFVLLIF